jgi:Uma2 family endonuclease
MAAAHRPQPVSVAKYFKREKQHPEICYEYLDGTVSMIAGGSFNHDTIQSNIQGILWSLLRGKTCRVYSSGMRTRVSETRYFHPDVVITCDTRDQRIDFSSEETAEDEGM